MKKQIRKKPGAPQQQRSILSKNRIIKAAEQVFAEKGLHGARIDEIANVSGVNKQRIYAYFGSKNALYREILLRVYTQAANDQRLTKLQDRDIPELTRIIIETFLEFHQSNPRFWRLLSWENLNKGKSLSDQDWSRIRSSYIQHLEHLYKIGQKHGQFKKAVNFSTYLMLLFAVTYFYFSNQMTISHLLNLKLTSKNVRRKMADELFNLVSNGILEPFAGYPSNINA